MRKFSQRRHFGFERLEGRRLLAADCMMQAMPEIDVMQPTTCEIASAEYPSDDIAAEVDNNAEVAEVSATEIVGTTIDPTESLETGEERLSTTTLSSPDPRVLDLADGMDGYFGSITSENPAETIEFTATADGIAQVVLASSFGDAQPSLSVSDSHNGVIEMQSEGNDGFDVLSFEVEAGETYQLTIASNDAHCEGQFQVTVGFEAHVDQHADQMGSESTELQLNDNSAKLSGRLETAGDTDTFRFTAATDGEVMLELHETVDDARIGLDICVLDADGSVLAEGATNQMLQMTFDVVEGQEYFVSLSAGEGQTGTYNIGLDLNANSELTTEPGSDCNVVVDQSSSEFAEPGNTETTIQESELAVNQPTESDVEADPIASSNCELADNGTEVANPDAAPIEGEPTDEVTSEPVDQRLCDQTPVELPQSSELLTSTEAPLVEQLPNAWVGCGTEELLVADTHSESEFGLGSGFDQEIADGELILATGDELVNSAEDLDEPIAAYSELDAVDNFFAELEEEFEFHFDFSFGRRHSMLV